MDEALELSSFMPVSYGTQSEGEYIAFLWDAFRSNYEGGKFEFASLAFHLLYMSYVGFSIWQIRLVREQDFRRALIGFQSESEMKLLSAVNPFLFYEQLKESQIFRFLKLIGCANEQVGEFSKFVKRRNKIAHPSGTVFFNDRAAIDAEIVDMMREVRNIESHMKPVISDMYGRFLLDSAEQEELQYDTLDQEIEVNLIHRDYVSLKDIEICLEYDISVHAAHQKFELIGTLHHSLSERFGADIADVAA
ncbi:hypothetical protein [Mesorhizobium sp.]|uniref:hypothetical protein n=1 Tax=Mesorhizobium sp. TaxID=1871066 RepID=UPI000FEA2DB8|nr:hypothetical protein [Mesorhizobium sp.]RWE95155.1 MAG: hypothetical protein EOS43_25555 [Mesorhizobium sp.]